MVINLLMDRSYVLAGPTSTSSTSSAISIDDEDKLYVKSALEQHVEFESSLDALLDDIDDDDDDNDNDESEGINVDDTETPIANASSARAGSVTHYATTVFDHTTAAEAAAMDNLPFPQRGSRRKTAQNSAARALASHQGAGSRQLWAKSRTAVTNRLFCHSL